MFEVRTIFLALDGRHVTLGRGDDVDMPQDMQELAVTIGSPGFVAILTGIYYGKRRVALSRVHNVGAADDQWDEAVVRFLAARPK